RLFLKPGGFVPTLISSGQQWDAPNGWAPLEWLAIEGVRRYGRADLADAARARWLALNRRTYRATGKMTEKYDVVDLLRRAGGGEYPTQDGFGWTNGVALALARGVLQHSAVPSPGFSLGNQSALGLSRSSTYAVVISAACDNPCGKLPSCSPV